MRNRKVKIPQYLVRGKHRDFHVLVFPRLKHTWAYYDSDSEHYAIDADIQVLLASWRLSPCHCPKEDLERGKALSLMYF